MSIPTDSNISAIAITPTTNPDAPLILIAEGGAMCLSEHPSLSLEARLQQSDSEFGPWDKVATAIDTCKTCDGKNLHPKAIMTATHGQKWYRTHALLTVGTLTVVDFSPVTSFTGR